MCRVSKGVAILQQNRNRPKHEKYNGPFGKAGTAVSMLPLASTFLLNIHTLFPNICRPLLVFSYLSSLLSPLSSLTVGATSGGSGSNGGGGVASMSGVIYSDDESDLSVVSDIDEGVIASEF